MSGYNLPDDVTQDMIDAHYEPSEADLASMLPAEPFCPRCGHECHTYDACRAEKRRDADWIVLCGCNHNDRA